MNPAAAEPAGPRTSERLLKSVRAGVAVSAELAGQAAQIARRAGKMLPTTIPAIPDWRAWLDARRDLNAAAPTFVRDEAKHRVILSRMSGIAALSEPEEQAVSHVTSAERRIHQASSELAVEGEISPKPMFIVSGWAARIRHMAGSRPQVVGFLLPGDGIAIRGCSEPRATTTIVAHTTLETVDGTQLMQMAADDRFPAIGHALGRLAVQDEEFLVNQITRLTTASAPERVAHLMLELHWRLGQAGLVNEQGFELPLEDDVLGNSIGLSGKRVRRALDELQRLKAMRLRYGEAQVINPATLARIGAFSPPRECGCGRNVCYGNHVVENQPRRDLIDGVRRVGAAEALVI
jgi:CRP-like cAMP-binding protein